MTSDHYPIALSIPCLKMFNERNNKTIAKYNNYKEYQENVFKKDWMTEGLLKSLNEKHRLYD